TAGRHASVVGELADLLSRYPLRERTAAHLMLAHYRCGNANAALEVYQRIRAHLAAELGLDPGPELNALRDAILRREPSLAAPSHRRPDLTDDAQDPAGPAGVRVVLVDDHPMFRSGLRLALETGTGVTVVGEASSVQEALSTVAETVPDVVVMDLHLPDASGV